MSHWSTSDTNKENNISPITPLNSQNIWYMYNKSYFQLRRYASVANSKYYALLSRMPLVYRRVLSSLLLDHRAQAQNQHVVSLWKQAGPWCAFVIQNIWSEYETKLIVQCAFFVRPINQHLLLLEKRRAFVRCHGNGKRFERTRVPTTGKAHVYCFYIS
jgi:hypothetical protein